MSTEILANFLREMAGESERSAGSLGAKMSKFHTANIWVDSLAMRRRCSW